MEQERIRDDISKVFADLTALLENTAGLATDGQSRRCTVADLENLVEQIWPEASRIIRVLAALERLIALCPSD